MKKNLRFYSFVAEKKFVRRRALMYVPSDDERKFRKATTQLRADCIALDIEDGVALDRKQNARESIRTFIESGLTETMPNLQAIEWAVRLNSVDSGLLEDDLKTVVTAKRVPKTLLLPKVESSADLKYVSIYNDMIAF